MGGTLASLDYLDRHPRLAGEYDAVHERLVRLGAVGSLAELAERYRALDDRLAAVAAAAAAPGETKAAPVPAATDVRREVRLEALALAARAVQLRFDITPWDRQLVGALGLLRGDIVELPNGEGKTLMAAMAACAAALEGSVHVVTANDYLVARDAEWMYPLYAVFGLGVGMMLSAETSTDRLGAVIASPELFDVFSRADSPERQAALYRCPILYGKIESFGFAYLRDQLATSPAEIHFERRDLLVVDEADYVLIDRLNTPIQLTRAEAHELRPALYAMFALARALVPGEHFVTQPEVELTDAGLARAAEATGRGDLYSRANLGLAPLLVNALKALHGLRAGSDYVVDGGEVIPIDTDSGRLQYDSRYSDLLHEAVRIKEGLPVATVREVTPLAKITIKNLLKQYRSTAGMTGNAGADEEYRPFYRMAILRLPSRRATRDYRRDRVYRSKREKVERAAADVIERWRRKPARPQLINADDAADAHVLSRLLAAHGVPHELLEAAEHRREAEKLAGAGELGAVVVSVKMAGRGTDIRLSEAARQAGGLHVVGLGRSSARRIDEQLCGRAARHGDPGSCQFFLSLEDTGAMVPNAPEIVRVLEALGHEDGEEIESPLVDRSIRRAQRLLARNFGNLRSLLVRFDDVLERQRTYYYFVRRGVLEAAELDPYLERIAENFVVQRTRPLAVRSFHRPDGVAAALRSLGDVGDAFTQVEIDLLGQSRDLVRFRRALSQLLGQKLAVAVAAAGEGDDDRRDRVRQRLLGAMDAAWSSYLFEVSEAYDEAQIQADAIGEMFTFYFRRMEARFDSLFLEVGARLLASLLATRRAAAFAA